MEEIIKVVPIWLQGVAVFLGIALFAGVNWLRKVNSGVPPDRHVLVDPSSKVARVTPVDDIATDLKMLISTTKENQGILQAILSVCRAQLEIHEDLQDQREIEKKARELMLEEREREREKQRERERERYERELPWNPGKNRR